MANVKAFASHRSGARRGAFRCETAISFDLMAGPTPERMRPVDYLGIVPSDTKLPWPQRHLFGFCAIATLYFVIREGSNVRAV